MARNVRLIVLCTGVAAGMAISAGVTRFSPFASIHVLAVEARSRLSNTPPALRRIRITVTPPVSTARP